MTNHVERYTTKELEAHIRAIYEKLIPLAKKDGVYKELDDYFNTGTSSGQDGSICYSDEEGYHYCVIERGTLLENIVTDSLSEITYQAISSDVFWMAVKYERAHRVKHQDFRRLLFEKEMQYWKVLGEDLAARAKLKIEDALEKVPFID